jgi:hypothetical protein
MSTLLSAADLASTLMNLATATGGTIAKPDDHTVTGHVDAILAKWFLGSRNVTYRFRLTLDEAAHRVRFRESSSEVVWGMPPPTFTVERTSQSGTRVTKQRTDVSLSGGGTLDYGGLRDAVEAATEQAGWEFVFEPLGRP